MDPSGTYASVTTDDITVESNTESLDAMRANFGIEPPKDDATPAADDKLVETPAPVAETKEPAKADADRNADGTFKAKAGKPRDDPQARIDQAISRQREAERRADAAEARLRERTAPVEAPKPAAPTIDPRDPEPDPTDLKVYAEGQYDRKFIKDQARWEARQERKAYEAELQERTRQATWKERLTAARKKTPDFDARINPDTVMSVPMQEFVKDSEVGPDLLLYFSEHPDDAQRLSTLHPIQLIRELGRLEVRVEAAPLNETGSAPPPIASQAKAPITPVTASPSVTDPDEESEDEPVEKFFARENARERKAGRR